jgi:hypothetical protein
VNKRVLLGISVGIVFALQTMVFAQAAAESALIHGLSSTATVNAGSSLGRALNQGSSQIGTRIQEHTSNSVQVVTPQNGPKLGWQTRAAGSPPRIVHAPGVSGVSVQGGDSGCKGAEAKSQPADNKGSATPASGGCRGKESGSKSQSEDKYKSFVTLPAPR